MNEYAYEKSCPDCSPERLNRFILTLLHIPLTNWPFLHRCQKPAGYLGNDIKRLFTCDKVKQR